MKILKLVLIFPKTYLILKLSDYVVSDFNFSTHLAYASVCCGMYS